MLNEDVCHLAAGIQIPDQFNAGFESSGGRADGADKKLRERFRLGSRFYTLTGRIPCLSRLRRISLSTGALSSGDFVELRILDFCEVTCESKQIPSEYRRVCCCVVACASCGTRAKRKPTSHF